MSKADTIKNLLPPCLLPVLRWWCGASFKGNYSNWDAAMEASSGYEEKNTLEYIIESSRKVRDGECSYERDGTIFENIEYAWPLLTGIMTAAANNQGNLKVLDFGGALGSSYRQNLAFLNTLQDVFWAVIETPELTKAGKSEFQTESLVFFDSIDSACEDCHYDVALLASVLPYLSKPYTILKDIIARSPDFIVLDRTMVRSFKEDRLTVQTNSSMIGKSSYPAWFFSEANLLAAFEPDYQLVSDFSALGDKVLLRSPFASANFKGYIFKHK